MSRLAVPSYLPAPSPGGNQEVVFSANGGSARRKQPDYTDRLLKYVPTESVTIFLAINMGIISAYKVPVDGSKFEFGNGAVEWPFWLVSIGILIVGVVGTPLYLYARRDTTPVVNGMKPPWVVNTMIGTAAFLVWAYSIGGTLFVAWHWFNPIAGAFFVAAFTFLMPLIPTKR